MHTNMDTRKLNKSREHGLAGVNHLFELVCTSPRLAEMDPGVDVNTGNPDLDAKIKEWMSLDKNEKSRAEIQHLVDQNAVEELEKRLCSRMEFGTAGLRARMGAGYSMMNDLTIIQTAQGLVKYLLKICPKVKEKGVVIGFDGRHNSYRFAHLSAVAFTSQEIPVYLFSKMTPTPFVPYCISKKGCQCGVMVTASHNPKDDNGYKVYWDNGAQIISPHDKGIASSIVENLEPWENAWLTEKIESNPLSKDPYEEINKSYFEDIKHLCHHSSTNQNSSLRFTYTAMHGVGYASAKMAFQAFNFKPPIPVKEQVEPDPDFPTVKFPNPEEGKSALDLAMRTADENNSTVILANDPDADRLAVAEKQPNNEWHVFTGNELGALFGWWLWTSYKEDNPDAKGSDVYMLASTVSSKILKSIGIKEGFNFIETLTGFKWMGNQTYDLVKSGKTVLFAYEEAIGFMCGATVLDKDGVSALAVAAEMATHLAEGGSTLMEQLQKIYATYGHHVSKNSYFFCHHPPTVKSLFENLRNFNGNKTYPSSCGPYAVKYVRDLTTGHDDSQPDKKAVSEMIRKKWSLPYVPNLLKP